MFNGFRDGFYPLAFRRRVDFGKLNIAGRFDFRDFDGGFRDGLRRC